MTELCQDTKPNNDNKKNNSAPVDSRPTIPKLPGRTSAEELKKPEPNKGREKADLRELKVSPLSRVRK